MKRYSILGVGVDGVSAPEFLDHARTWLGGGFERPRFITTVNPEIVMEAQHNEPFKNALNKADCALADGVGLSYASYLLFGKPTFQRITGVSATLLLSELAAQTGASVYLAGSKEGVAKKAAADLARRFVGLRIAGAEIGLPFGSMREEEDSRALLSRIHTSCASILFLALGAPKQELWIAEHLKALKGVKIVIGVGGTFDYLSGTVPYAPPYIRSLGFEWFYRLLHEPNRLNRIITATIRFPAAVFKSRLTPRP